MSNETDEEIIEKQKKITKKKRLTKRRKNSTSPSKTLSGKKRRSSTPQKPRSQERSSPVLILDGSPKKKLAINGAIRTPSPYRPPRTTHIDVHNENNGEITGSPNNTSFNRSAMDRPVSPHLFPSPDTRTSILGPFIYMVNTMDNTYLEDCSKKDLQTMLKQMTLLRCELNRKFESEKIVHENELLKCWQAVFDLEEEAYSIHSKERISEEVVKIQKQLLDMDEVVEQVNNHIAPVFEKLNSYVSMKTKQVEVNKYLKSIKSFNAKATINHEYNSKLAELEKAVRALQRTSEKPDWVKPPIKDEVKRINSKENSPITISPMGSPAGSFLRRKEGPKSKLSFSNIYRMDSTLNMNDLPVKKDETADKRVKILDRIVGNMNQDEKIKEFFTNDTEEFLHHNVDATDKLRNFSTKNKRSEPEEDDDEEEVQVLVARNVIQRSSSRLKSGSIESLGDDDFAVSPSASAANLTRGLSFGLSPDLSPKSSFRVDKTSKKKDELFNSSFHLETESSKMKKKKKLNKTLSWMPQISKTGSLMNLLNANISDDDKDKVEKEPAKKLPHKRAAPNVKPLERTSLLTRPTKASIAARTSNIPTKKKKTEKPDKTEKLEIQENTKNTNKSAENSPVRTPPKSPPREGKVSKNPFGDNPLHTPPKPKTDDATEEKKTGSVNQLSSSAAAAAQMAAALNMRSMGKDLKKEKIQTPKEIRVTFASTDEYDKGAPYQAVIPNKEPVSIGGKKKEFHPLSPPLSPTEAKVVEPTISLEDKFSMEEVKESAISEKPEDPDTINEVQAEVQVGEAQEEEVEEKDVSAEDTAEVEVEVEEEVSEVMEKMEQLIEKSGEEDSAEVALESLSVENVPQETSVEDKTQIESSEEEKMENTVETVEPLNEENKLKENEKLDEEKEKEKTIEKKSSKGLLKKRSHSMGSMDEIIQHITEQKEQNENKHTAPTMVKDDSATVSHQKDKSRGSWKKTLFSFHKKKSELKTKTQEEPPVDKKIRAVPKNETKSPNPTMKTKSKESSENDRSEGKESGLTIKRSRSFNSFYDAMKELEEPDGEQKPKQAADTLQVGIKKKHSTWKDLLGLSTSIFKMKKTSTKDDLSSHTSTYRAPKAISPRGAKRMMEEQLGDIPMVDDGESETNESLGSQPTLGSEKKKSVSPRGHNRFEADTPVSENSEKSEPTAESATAPRGPEDPPPPISDKVEEEGLEVTVTPANEDVTDTGIVKDPPAVDTGVKVLEDSDDGDMVDMGYMELEPIEEGEEEEDDGVTPSNGKGLRKRSKQSVLDTSTQSLSEAMSKVGKETEMEKSNKPAVEETKPESYNASPKNHEKSLIQENTPPAERAKTPPKTHEKTPSTGQDKGTPMELKPEISEEKETLKLSPAALATLSQQHAGERQSMPNLGEESPEKKKKKKMFHKPSFMKRNSSSKQDLTAHSADSFGDKGSETSSVASAKRKGLFGLFRKNSGSQSGSVDGGSDKSSVTGEKKKKGLFHKPGFLKKKKKDEGSG